MKPFIVLLSLALLASLSGCAGLPARSYSLSYTDAQGRTISGGVTLPDTSGLRK